jgi:4-diphosphocytidyl-2-C-methyl-D-erythritol kinase
MDLRRNHLTRRARAPAKLNLYLEILGRRDDGFHELETVMVPITLCDSLSLEPTPPQDSKPGALRLAVRHCFPVRSGNLHPPIPGGAENLVVRALEALRRRSGCEFGADVELVKRIPSAAGLGGGSSDAAAALKLANRAWRLNWPLDRLSDLAAEIGSDVPFFLHGGPAICRGRGERVERIAGIRAQYFVIVKPPDELSTADVYRAHDASDASGQRERSAGRVRLDAIEGEGVRSAGSWMFNRLEEAAATVSPWVSRLRAAFEKLDVLGHQLSGSGSAYFGVCRNARHARRFASVLRSSLPGLIYATRSGA